MGHPIFRHISVDVTSLVNISNWLHYLDKTKGLCHSLFRLLILDQTLLEKLPKICWYQPRFQSVSKQPDYLHKYSVQLAEHPIEFQTAVDHFLLFKHIKSHEIKAANFLFGVLRINVMKSWMFVAINTDSRKYSMQLNAKSLWMFQNMTVEFLNPFSFSYDYFILPHGSNGN